MNVDVNMNMSMYMSVVNYMNIMNTWLMVLYKWILISGIIENYNLFIWNEANQDNIK